MGENILRPNENGKQQYESYMEVVPNMEGF